MRGASDGPRPGEETGVLFLNNDDVRQLLTMEMTVQALERAYGQLATEEAVCRPRIDIQIRSQRASQAARISGGPWREARPRVISQSG